MKIIIPAPKKLISNFIINTSGKVISQKLVINASGSKTLKLIDVKICSNFLGINWNFFKI